MNMKQMVRALIAITGIGVSALPLVGLCQPVTLTTVGASRAKPIHEGLSIYERVSRDELNRLQVVDGRIKTMHFKSQDLEVVKDEDNGQAFFTPKTDKTISVFITTQSGVTFTLILQPVPKMPAVNVLVQEAGGTSVAHMRASDTKPEVSPVNSMSYEQAISTLIYSAATQQTLPGVSEEKVNQSIPLWEQAAFVHVRTLSSAGMQLGEYRLTNTSQTTMRLVEQELYKPGVLAVAVEQHLLAPGESTPVFVVLGGGR